MTYLKESLKCLGGAIFVIGWCSFMLIALLIVSLWSLMKDCWRLPDKRHELDKLSVCIERIDDVWVAKTKTDGQNFQALGRGPGSALKNLRQNYKTYMEYR